MANIYNQNALFQPVHKTCILHC